MKTKIKVGQYNIKWLGDNFKEHFGDIEVSPKKCKLVFKILERYMNDKEILDEFKPKEITLDEFVYALKTKKGLLTNGYKYINIFYIRDSENTLWAVYSYWLVDDGGWDVDTGSVSGPYRWDQGNQVVSQAFSSVLRGA